MISCFRHARVNMVLYFAASNRSNVCQAHSEVHIGFQFLGSCDGASEWGHASYAEYGGTGTEPLNDSRH